MARKRLKGRKPPPRCKAILLCDRTIIEAVTGKVSIIGIFNNWILPQFPCQIQPFMAFLELAEGVGKYSILVEIHDLGADQIIAQAMGPQIEFRDRLAKVSLMLPVPPLVLHHAGSYDFVVLADGQEIDRQQFIAQQQPGGAGDATDPA